MIMFANYTGRIRTRDEFSALLAAAGFRMARVLATTSALSILEARPA